MSESEEKEEFDVKFDDIKDRSWLSDDEIPDPDLIISVIQSYNLEKYIRAKLKEKESKARQKNDDDKKEQKKENWQFKTEAKKELINLADKIVKQFIDHIIGEFIELLHLMQKKTFTHACSSKYRGCFI